ncbi:uncharacterized protein IL334_000929 [Kwoniella shivajii]|uniref:NAD(P)-binding protein n=1 Tax=Kwoniella shivajii TaxID=564305 RepID=A0ABZ1CUR9_9TREE|nr:hypothetical protein IL334_000929 [Kwoniella shivajii]
MPTPSIPWSIYRDLWTPMPAGPKGPYLAGKIVVITGATSGIGLEAIKQLAKASPEQLILAARSIEAGEKVLNDLKKAHPNIKGKVIYLDLMKLESFKSFVEELKAFDRVDLLINNAGINPMFEEAPYKSTEDGYERTFQVNVLAPLLLTLMLVPQLTKSSEPKVIYSGSDGHLVADSDLIETSISNNESIVKAYNDAGKYQNPKRYFESKLLLQMTTRSLIKYLPSISTINVNPGLAMTNLGREWVPIITFETFRTIVWVMFNTRTVGKAARNLTSAAAWQGGSQDYWTGGVPAASENLYLYSGKGVKATQQFFEEMLEEVEKISPGCTSDISLKQ